MIRPSAGEVSDRALVLYALVRRGTIEYVVAETEGDFGRIRQAEAARREADDWLEREAVWPAVTEAERRLFEGPSGSWPREAVADAMWRKEALGTLLWALEHLETMPQYGLEFELAVQGVLRIIGAVVVGLGYLIPLGVIALIGWGVVRLVRRRDRGAN